MKTDVNGCSTCLAGQEQWEQFYMPRYHKKMYQYEYRHPVTGTLFTTISPTLALARNRRDVFVAEENIKERNAEMHYFHSHPELNP